MSTHLQLSVFANSVDANGVAWWVTSILIPLVVAAVTVLILQPIAWYLRGLHEARKEREHVKARRREIEEFLKSADISLVRYPCEKHPDQTLIGLAVAFFNNTRLPVTLRSVMFAHENGTYGTRFCRYFKFPSEKPSAAGDHTATLPPHTAGSWRCAVHMDCYDGPDRPKPYPPFTGIQVTYEFSKPRGYTETSEFEINSEKAQALNDVAAECNKVVMEYWEKSGKNKKGT
ncbi:MAG: hypothetical protein ACYSWU_05350 [Planctomycetota bacterium]|jgi:hypothetical protein